MKDQAKGLLKWISGTISDALDLAKDDRIATYAAQLEAEFARLRKAFNFTDAVTALGIDEHDRPMVAERVYTGFLERAWKDSQVSDREKEMLDWVASTLGLTPAVVTRLNTDAATSVFRNALAKAIADGRVDEDEGERLKAIAGHTGHSIGMLMARLFEREGDSLLRSIFSQAASDGRLEREEWKEFRHTAERLGIPKEQMLHAIRQPARQLVEHTLVDARSDGEISEREERVLLSLLDNIISDQAFADYVREQIEESKEMQRVAKGVLPSLPWPTGVALRAGEIVHWHGPAQYARTRELASGTKTEQINGDAVITDTRMILNASEKSFEVAHRRVLAHFPFGHALEIRASGKGAGRYLFGEERPVVIWQVAIGRANQTIVASDDAQARRRISREIRQRVWQRYGGRCAECSSDTYLEFDHIIPVAKGGGNSETNVQLLCRKCNLAKSDSI
jgi:tellurite resistance protein